MFNFKKKEPDWDLNKLSDEELESVPLYELQRIRIKRWAHKIKHLQIRAEQELERRDPRKSWACKRCERKNFHEREIRVAGNFAESFLNIQANKYHAVTCNYCGSTEFYSVLFDGSILLDVLGN